LFEIIGEDKDNREFKRRSNKKTR